MENKIESIVVVPKTDRLYNYWINGSKEKRTMFKERMRNFCLDLVPKKARSINRCVDELLPFALIVEEDFFQELAEAPPEPTKKSNISLPLREKIKNNKKIQLSQEKTIVRKEAERFGLHNIFKQRKL